MKSLKETDVIPSIDPERTVEYIVRNRRKDRMMLPQATKAKDLKCPDCGSKSGFYNYLWGAWACKENDCNVHWLPETSALKIGYIERKLKEKK